MLENPTLQFLRAASLQAVNKSGQSFTFAGLRFSFDIEKTSESGVNTGKIEIYNLNQDSRTFFESEGVKVQLQAGYTDLESGREIISSGDVKKGVSIFNPPEWVTTLEVYDGKKALDSAKVSTSFSPGTPYQAILTKAIESIKDAGISIGSITTAITEIAVGGFSFSGSAEQVLNKMAKKFGFEWSIQDEALQITPNDGTPVPGLAVLVSTDTGLIGNIIRREKNIEFKSLLNGKIKPGGLVNLKSSDTDGFYKVRKVKFIGDTHGIPWFSEVEAEPT